MPKAKEEGKRSGTPHKEKSTAKRYTGRRYSKRSKENIQNTKGGMDGHKNRKGGYA